MKMILKLLSSFVLLGVLRALKIDGQLAVIKNDCYERLAVGERHHPKAIFKSSNTAKTVFECQLLCTDEKENCKSFSFGVGVKGNATCELSKDTVKETADLKPIGTKSDTEYDLYIKKLGCTLVIDKNNPAFDHYKPQNKPATSGGGYGTPTQKPEAPYSQPPSPGYDKPSSGYKPSNGGYEKPVNNGYLPQNRPTDNNYGASSPPGPIYKPQEEVQHVQTLVSISNGPKPVMHPYQEILVGEGLYNYARPPFRPPSIDNPYDRPFRPRPDDYDRPNTDRYDSGPSESNFYAHRPIPDRYGSYIPRPDHYNDYYKPRPNPGDYYRPRPLIDDYKPRPKPPPSDYDRPMRPGIEYKPGPDYGYYDERPVKPDYNRPNLGEYNQRPLGPERPLDYDRPIGPKPGDYHQRPMRPIDYDRPNFVDYNQRPLRPNPSGYDRPNFEPPRPDRPPDYDKPRPNYDKPRPDYDKPRPDYDKPRPGYDKPRPDYNKPRPDYDKPRPDYEKPRPDYDKPRPDYNKPGPQDYDRPNPGDYNQKPSQPIKPESGYDRRNPSYDRPSEYLFNKEVDRYDSQPETPKPIQGYKPGTKPEDSNKVNSGYENPKDPHKKPIVTQSLGPHGESITSIITELEEACFRRVLAGKRVTRALVKRALYCERVEDCQRECSEEKRFACEGFNYRLDPSGRGKGECELLQIPLSHLDIGRDLYPDPDYDYYERDRNAASANCRRPSYKPGYDYGAGYDRRPEQRPYDWWEQRRPGNRRPRPDYGFDRRPGYDYDGYGDGNRRGDFAYHEHDLSPHYDHKFHYDAPYDYPSYEPYLPPNRRPFHDYDRDRDRKYWGVSNPWGSYGTNYDPSDFDRKNYYLPPPNGGDKYWGQYGGSYGNGGLNLQYNGYGHSQSFDFWGLNKYEEKFHNYGELPPKQGGYLPVPKPPGNGYLPELPPKPPGGGYLPDNTLKPPFSSGGGYLPSPPSPSSGSYLPLPGKPDDYRNNAILPAEPRYPYYYDFLKDECSLRSAAGFRLHKGIVKKFVSVPSIYECELLCFKEKEFPCASYAFRYSTGLNAPIENCYLSNRNYKELDFYTDLEPDRNFDVYTMNNMKRCEQPLIPRRDDSECFWRVRSAQRFDHKIVRDSLTVKSIVECQLECLRSKYFTCRAFSFRYGSPVIGRPGDNCLLTDWPYYELDARIHFVPEPGFEIYERGSFGHGCEPNPFGVGGRPSSGTKLDQLCYAGFGSPATLLKVATRKELNVATEEECKAECSKYRDKTLFQCMSLSFNPKSPKWEPNCKLSDILQRDLLLHADYVLDQDSWLFAWDNYNPQCRTVANKPIHGGNGIRKEGKFDYDNFNAIGTWRVYSVSGWPCRRGTLCRQNPIGGFWFCELEGGDDNTWDYCCRPDHQCGFSEGFQYQWCYVGPERTQWRKCSDRYYPYIHNVIDRFDRPQHGQSGAGGYLPNRPQGGGSYLPDRPSGGGSYLPDRPLGGGSYPPDRPPGGGGYLPDRPLGGGGYIPGRPPGDGSYLPHRPIGGGSYLPIRPTGGGSYLPIHQSGGGSYLPERPTGGGRPPHRPGYRPDRPPAPPTQPPPQPSLDEYEMQFQNQFLDPPKPGGFGQPRHWPLSYLHKEMPPNTTDSESMLTKAARKMGVNPKFAAIQNLIDVIKSNDLKNIQYQITNASNNRDDILFVKIPLPTNFTEETKKVEKIVANTTEVMSDPIDLDVNLDVKNTTKRSQKALPSQERPQPVYRKGYITRTNITRSRT